MPQPLSSPPPLHPTLNPAVLTQALTSLSPALELLARFHHRNKNQHRLSKWWAQADMLRRHLRKMVEELEDGLVKAEGAVKGRERARGKAKMRGDGKMGSKKGENEVVRKRAEYLRWKLGPGAFLAFTQLTADRQFAHLGLMLLGVLAQVDQALTPFAPSPSNPPDEPLTTPESLSQTLQPPSLTTSLLTQPPDIDTDMTTDIGHPVSRSSILLSIELPPQGETATSTPASALTPSHTPLPPPTTTTTPQPDRASSRASLAGQQNLGSDGDDYDGAAQLKRKETSTTKKRRVVGGDEFDDIFGGLSDDERGKSSKTKAKTKSGGGKKKKAAGDEFDDIFGAEAGEKKRKKRKESGEDNGGAVKAAIKKKKKVGGDEFDDIFGGMDDDGGKKVKAKKKVGKKRDEFDDIFGGYDT